MNESSLESRIAFVIQELERPLVSQTKRLELLSELNLLLAKRKIMIETLAKPNDYKGLPDYTDGSSDIDEDE